jgi:bifunctional DNA-binding transcriptional regulator/antitoxin component of YhaV-PrlF toxin-antitoxin module
MTQQRLSLDDEGRLTLPAGGRGQLDLHPGDWIEFLLDGGCLVLRKVSVQADSAPLPLAATALDLRPDSASP